MTEATTASPALIPFASRHEGRVHKAYKDSGSVITIGIGFTSLSKMFADYWVKQHGHRLKLGDTISDAECDFLLGKLLAEEYAPPVAKRFRGTGIQQHEFDAATDMSFNCGPGALKWKWATQLAARAIATAATLLRSTAVTAGGKTLKGLQRRRADEAQLMETGDYGSGTVSASTGRDDIKAYQQQLATLGLYAGTIDGIAGTATLAAIRLFQQENDLIVDGVVGPATRAALTRAVEARQAGQAAGGGAVVGTAAGGATETAQQAGQMDWSTLVTALEWGLTIAIVLGVAFVVWRNRGVILRRRTAA